MKRWLYWVLVAVTAALYATMAIWTFPVISAAANGIPSFELRLSGYSAIDARAFLDALSPEGEAFYRDVQHPLDLVFPALFALSLGVGIFALLPRAIGFWRYVAVATAIPVAVFDYLENGAVAAMLDADSVTDAMIATASGFTVMKFVSIAVCVTVLIAAAVARWLRSRRSAPT